jgi:hypothetical protein
MTMTGTTSAEFIAKLKHHDDEMLEMVAVMFLTVAVRRPNAKAAEKALRAELKRRHMGARVDRLVAAAKATGEAMADQAVVANLPDGSQIMNMPGATVTAKWVKREPSGTA